MKGSLTILLFFLCGAGCIAQAQPILLIDATTTQWHYNQEGIDLGATWLAPGFDVSSWPIGVGLFGIDNSDYGLPFNTPLTRPEPDTTYFVSSFDWSGNPSGLILCGTLRVDDGCIIYINGHETYRFNITADPVVYATGGIGTYADSHHPGGEPVIQAIELLGTNVVDGVNRIGVQLIQASDRSSDAVFGLSLSANFAFSPTNSTPARPKDSSILEGRSHTLQASFDGLPTPHLQWYRNQLPIPGETNPSLSIVSMSRELAGHYICRSSNVVGILDSRVATINFEADIIGPNLESGFLDEGGSIGLRFDEPMDSFIDVFGLFVYPRGGDPFLDDLLVQDATLLPDGKTFSVTTQLPPQPGVSYVVDVDQGAALDIYLNHNEYIAEVHLSDRFRAVAFDSVWTYLEDGSNQGMAWREIDYDDRGWSSGPGALGFEPNLTPAELPLPTIQTPFRTTGMGGPTTVYFRTVFALPTLPCYLDGARLRAVFDDGMVAYINGQEIARQGVPIGHDYSTQAAIHEADEIVEFDVDPSLLTEGINVLAVELHQASTASSDAVWAGELMLDLLNIGECFENPIIEHPTPATQTVHEGAMVTYSVVALAFPRPHFQWQKDGIDIANATNKVLNLEVTSIDSGIYRCVVQTSFGTAISHEAELIVHCDCPALTLLDGISLSDGVTIELNFSPSLDPVSASDLSHYQVERIDGGQHVQVTNVVVDGTSVLLKTEKRPIGNYQVTISGLREGSVRATLISPNPTINSLPSEVLLLKANNAHLWRYLDDGTDQGAAWREPLFDDENWPRGMAAFYYRDPPGNNVIPTRTTLSPTNSTGERIITYYYRTTFDFPYDPVKTPARLQYMIDDGAIFYINGQEVHRVGMPSTNEILTTTLATRTQGTDLDLEERVEISTDYFVIGDNHLAVEVHQRSTTSSDTAMATRVLAIADTVHCIPKFDTIRFNSEGELLLEFDDCFENILIQATSGLPGSDSSEAWITLPGGPHSSPFNVGQPDGSQFFRLKTQ